MLISAHHNLKISKINVSNLHIHRIQTLHFGRSFFLHVEAFKGLLEYICLFHKKWKEILGIFLYLLSFSIAFQYNGVSSKESKAKYCNIFSGFHFFHKYFHWVFFSQ